MKKPIPFGKYYLLERINVGGMAEVFRAKAFGVEGFERLVAVKRILPNIAEDKDFIRMFVDEAKIAVQLNHANIAQIFDLGMVDGSYYIALEHIHGRDLRAIFDRNRSQGQPMPVAQACFVVMKVCEGLDYAHNKRDQSGRELKLVHRDVSPQNMLVSFEGEVKLIDFGIAKAAGKGSKTQAGILKGKFGYMSPEQVRGLPIDRRSDIFSCGIVLYELLTGERLFVGESDFSTLEKVRNVEILPPSTYNRKIPDELERIVLKALAKDPDDRYQNAIDLHDELQAFVYTAGEFYSRKDLAGWMKRTFAREIEEETQKLESYRRLRPPEQRAESAPPLRAPTGDPRRTSLGMGAVRPPPPPPPVPGGRRSSQMPVPAQAAAAAAANPANPDDLEWDDDELETQIYDDDEPRSVPGNVPAAGRPPTAQPIAAGGAALAAAAADEPDLSSLIQTGRGWDAPPPPSARRDTGSPAPTNLANGSGQTPSPYANGNGIELGANGHASDLLHGPSTVPDSAPGYGVPIDDNTLPDPVLDGLRASPASMDVPMTRVQPQKRSSRTILYAAAAAATLIVAGSVTAVLLLTGDGGDRSAAAAPATAASPAELPREVLDKTGFDLIIEPADAKVKLDGKVVDLRPPMSIRNLAPGSHTVEIEGPPGFFSKTRKIEVVAGKAEQITIPLDPIDIAGTFTSEPPGASVTLVADGERVPLGEAPATHTLDPRKQYEVVFEKEGYVTQSKPVAISGKTEELVTAVLERAGRQYVASAPPSPPKATKPARGSATLLDAPKAKPERPAPPEPKVVEPAPRERGVLMIGSKPPCDIYIDGKNTNLTTPQREIPLPAGRHKVTLINNEHKIRETFMVNILPGKKAKVVKDMTDKIQ